MKELNKVVMCDSGASKIRYIKSDILKGNTSYVVLDPKGELFKDTSYAMKQKGYNVKVLNLINLKDSNEYNPFNYLRDDTDIQYLVDSLFNSNAKIYEAAKELLSSLICYCLYFSPLEEKNFSKVLELLRMAHIKSKDNALISELDCIFENIESSLSSDDPRKICVDYYKKYKSRDNTTLQNVQIALAARLSKFENPDLQKLMSSDGLDLDMVGQEKTIIYAIVPIDNEDLYFLVNILYAQLFQRLFCLASNRYNGVLPVHFRFIMNEIVDFQVPDDFEKIISENNSLNFSVTIFLSRKTQIKMFFKEKGIEYIGNFDSIVNLDNKEKEGRDYL